ncbi:cellulose binding domain-containing protein [Mycobacterium tuberculosis]|nr:cellulose binding domain-containing protein [Mycobacterium tuberculosis variant bovis]MBA2785738.1 cellulose binding domain-containing protein [Mycobacterium canetti]MBC9047846.1 cellulose binding domain-containing protein [Mycobacterium tuberculosis variant caprae]MBC9050143.1 cellulose binding domain-containing protein [Mycobacterium tuberculosis variant africanum]MBP0655838.1 cellulose binding domain-containing protein [Mycobacterium tuberculosis]MBV1659792.1 cellulose binding domain-con
MATWPITRSPNSGATSMTDWRLQFTLPENASISNACCAQLAQSGTQYTLDAREL